MFEMLMIIAAVVLMVKVADFEDQSKLGWGVITLLLCIASLFMPLPFIRVGIAVVLAFAAMTTYKIIAKR